MDKNKDKDKVIMKGNAKDMVKVKGDSRSKVKDIAKHILKEIVKNKDQVKFKANAKF